MTKHALKHNGAAYNGNAELINPNTKVTSGAGRALCTCGILSEELPSGGARRAWHKAHRVSPVAVAPESTEQVLGQDVLEGTPEDEVADALAELVEPAPAAAPKAKKAPKAKRVADGPKDEANAFSQTLPFTAATPGFWRSLGRDAAKSVVDECFPSVTVTANNNSHTLYFQGPSDEVPSAVQAVVDMWAEAVVASKDWKKTDPTFLGRSPEPLARRREGYHLTEAFYVAFGTWYAHNLQGR